MNHLKITVLAAFIAAGAASLLLADSTNAADPTPVNPPGPIPAILSDSDGNRYEVFTPEEGGTIVREDYSLVAEPGDVPSAMIVGVRMIKGAEASNAGMTHHRYTIGGDFYVIDAVDANGRTPSPGFGFRNPPVACLPLPNKFLANIDSVRLIATDNEGATQTVLSSGARLDEFMFRICGYVGTIPTVLAVGMEGAPDPLPEVPEVEVELPVTGGASPNNQWILILLVGGILILVFAVVVARVSRRNKGS